MQNTPEIKRSEYKFPLGQIVATPAALDVLDAVDQMAGRYIARHAKCDWGDLCEHDRAMNDKAVISGGRLFSSYDLPDGNKIYVITEWDRSVTTVLLPEDY